MIHLEIEIAANMAYEWAVNFSEYCEAVVALQILEHATGKHVDDSKLLQTRDELKESSEAIMAIAGTNEFSEQVGHYCLHVEMFYLGIAFITNAQVMQEIKEGEQSLEQRNYLFVLNTEQNLIFNALTQGHERLKESEHESETKTETQSESSEKE